MNRFKPLRTTGALLLLVAIAFGDRCRAGIVTNVMLKTTFVLTAYVQEDTNSTTWTISNHKLGNADIVNAIISDTGLPASDYNSDSLILSSTILIPNKHLGFVLRSSAGAAPDTDISTNLDLTIPNSSQVITSIRPAPFGRTTNSVDLTIFQFALNTTGLTFNVQGPATLNSTSVTYKGRVIDKYPFTSLLAVNVAGTGTVNGKNAAFKGTFRASSRQVELGTARPNLASASRVDGTNLVIAGINGSPSNTFYILASTDLSAPLSNWLPVVTNVFDNTGSFTITNAIDPAVPQNFFILSAP
jgi:hypothetical protein